MIYFVVILEFAIWLIVFLYCIVCEVYHAILNIRKIVLFWGSTNVTVSVPVAFDHSIYCCYEDVAAKVKFAVLDKKTSFHIFLDN